MFTRWVRFSFTGWMKNDFLKAKPWDNDGWGERGDSVRQWSVFSRSTGGPLCSILHHWKAWVHVADPSAGCHGSQWRDRDVPITKDVLVVFLHTKHLFQIHLEQHKRGVESSEPGTSKYLCCSPKINNVASSVLHQSVQMESVSRRWTWSRWVVHIVNGVVIWRVSCVSTGIKDLYVSPGGQNVLYVSVTLRTHGEKLAWTPLITSEINIIIKTPHAACRAEGAELRQCSCEDWGENERMLFVLWRSVGAKIHAPKKKKKNTIVVICTSKNTSLCTSTHLQTNMGERRTLTSTGNLICMFDLGR